MYVFCFVLVRIFQSSNEVVWGTIYLNVSLKGLELTSRGVCAAQLLIVCGCHILLLYMRDQRQISIDPFLLYKHEAQGFYLEYF